MRLPEVLSVIAATACVNFLVYGDELEVKELVPMVFEAFKAEIKRRGWEPESLAIRWAMTKRRANRFIADHDRPWHYDDAVMVLPATLKQGNIFLY